MFVIIGIAVVLIAIVVGFTIAGGQLLLLLQWAEFMIIVGTGIGSMLIMSTPSMLKKIIGAIPNLFKNHSITKQDYLELLKSFNDLFLISQRDGLLSIEAHIESPEKSKVLSVNKKFIENKFAVNFFCDTMKIMLSGAIPGHELESLIDKEIETFEIESKPIPATITKIADSLPGIGIVAAVLGIIVTMSSIDEGAVAVGHHVAAALVGTFLGVLLSYGFVNPIATNIEHDIESKIRYLETIKVCIVAYAKGNPPIIAVEMARRTIFSDLRPTFSELENFIRGKKHTDG